jgi:hypothetical protein
MHVYAGTDSPKDLKQRGIKHLTTFDKLSLLRSERLCLAIAKLRVLGPSGDAVIITADQERDLARLQRRLQSQDDQTFEPKRIRLHIHPQSFPRGIVSTGQESSFRWGDLATAGFKEYRTRLADVVYKAQRLETNTEVDQDELRSFREAEYHGTVQYL